MKGHGDTLGATLTDSDIFEAAFGRADRYRDLMASAATVFVDDFHRYGPSEPVLLERYVADCREAVMARGELARAAVLL